MSTCTKSAPLVSCRGITKEFRRGEVRVAALRGVDLDVRAGELTLLVGPSGCGKTTLLSLIAGILDPTSGAVEVLGFDLGRISSRQKTSFRIGRIGFVFQQYNLLPVLTAAENAAVPLIIAGWPIKKAVAKACEHLETMGLSHKINVFPTQLSSGEQQRVAIARALVHQPQLIVCDEPTSALDAVTGRTIMELLQRVAVQPDRAVIVVTHDPRVLPFGDRIASMEDGRIMAVASHAKSALVASGFAPFSDANIS